MNRKIILITIIFFILSINNVSASYPLPFANWTSYSEVDSTNIFSHDTSIYPDAIKYTYTCCSNNPINNYGRLTQTITISSSDYYYINGSAFGFSTGSGLSSRILVNNAVVCEFYGSSDQTPFYCYAYLPIGTYDLSIDTYIHANFAWSSRTRYTYVNNYQSTSKFTISGKITYLDVDNTSHNLLNASVVLNSTINTTTNSNGDYSLSNIPNGNYNLVVSKGDAFNSISIAVSTGSPVGNGQLLFSHPLLSNPVILGSYIETTYSHNFKTMNLWSNPYYVWGIYNFDNNLTITKVCINVLNTNKFQCDLVQNSNYTFYFKYSDIYNYNLNIYHPTLTGNRNFTTSSIYVINGQIVNSNDIKSISLLPQGERENYLKGALPDMLLVMIIIFLSCVVLSFFNRGRHE